jgi:hypothetical protein
MTESNAYTRQKIIDTKLSAPLSNWQTIPTIAELRHCQIEAVEAEEVE